MCATDSGESERATDEQLTNAKLNLNRRANGFEWLINIGLSTGAACWRVFKNSRVGTFSSSVSTNFGTVTN